MKGETVLSLSFCLSVSISLSLATSPLPPSSSLIFLFPVPFPILRFFLCLPINQIHASQRCWCVQGREGKALKHWHLFLKWLPGFRRNFSSASKSVAEHNKATHCYPFMLNVWADCFVLTYLNSSSLITKLLQRWDTLCVCTASFKGKYINQSCNFCNSNYGEEAVRINITLICPLRHEF